MIMFTKEECAVAWANATNAGTVEERILRNEGWNVYFSNEAKHLINQPLQQNKKSKNVVNFLQSQNMFSKDSTILDLGCGVGSYSLEFSQYAKQVTAFDMSEQSLSVLRLNLEQKKIENVNLVCSMWETFETEDKFDLVFSAMCPAICNFEELSKMESMSNKSCAILTVSKGSYSKNRRELRELISTENLKGLSTEAVYVYNMLYAMGRNPQVKTYSEKFHGSIGTEEAKEKFKQYFSIFGFEKNKVAQIVENFVNQKSVDDVLFDETQLNTALIYWNV